MLNISTLAAGDRVQHELMVRSREDKTTRTGDPYAVVALGNRSGQISANVWKEQLGWIEGVRLGSIVQAIGSVETYQGRRQLKLTAPLRVMASREADLDEFLPRIAVEPETLWARVDEWRAALGSARLRTAVDLFFADDIFRASFEKAPASPRGHHAEVGGLLLHVVEVGTIAEAAAKTMHGSVDLVRTGALLHDIGKVEAFVATAAGFEMTPSGRLLGHVALGTILLERRLRTLPAGTLSEAHEAELHHFVVSHHGQREHGAAVEPMTLEADLLHWADEASANGNVFSEALEDRELFPADEDFAVRRGWRSSRTVWRRPERWD